MLYSGPVAAVVTNLLLREEEIDLQLNQEEEREVVGQFYIPISFIAPLLDRRRKTV